MCMVLVGIKESWKLGGMSDFCVDKLDNTISIEYHENDDGIVPDSANEDGGQFPVQVSSMKKQRYGYMGSGTNYLKSNTINKRENDMLGTNLWPEKSNGDTLGSHEESGKDVQDMPLDDTKISDNGFNGGHVDVVENLCTRDPMFGDNSAATQDGLYNYSLNNIPNSENNLSFLDNGDKESNDLLYGWGDIGNFDDVEKMLRSCDSTFGLDSLNNEDDLGWFSSAQPSEDTEATMTDDKKQATMLEDQRTAMLQVEDFLNNSEPGHVVEDEYGYTIVGGSALGKSSENASDTSLQKKDTMMLDEEANLVKKHTDHLHHLGGKPDGYSENNFALQHSGIYRELMETNQLYPPSAFQHPGVPYSHFNCEQPSDQVSACDCISGIKSETKTNPSSASNESCTSNQALSVESSQGPTVDDRCRKGFEKSASFPGVQAMPPSFAPSTRMSSKTNTMELPDAAPIQKIGLENGHRKCAAELETSNMQESPCVSSVVNDISLEATSFRQLKHVVEQLDVGTKLCIRDSLYRLAKSAEQRHKCMDPNVANRQENGAGSQLVTGETEKYVGFMGIETDTNPIDRSLAHLMFHRPSDSSLSSDNNVLSYKSHPMIPQPTSSPSLRIEKQEETPDVVTNENK